MQNHVILSGNLVFARISREFKDFIEFLDFMEFGSRKPPFETAKHRCSCNSPISLKSDFYVKIRNQQGNHVFNIPGDFCEKVEFCGNCAPRRPGHLKRDGIPLV